jgi:acetyltransferase-like isoleucine patch superfamily enzyme
VKLLIRIALGLASRWRNVWYRALGVRMDGYCWLRAIEIPQDWDCIHLGEGVALDRGVVLRVFRTVPEPRLEIGAGTYVNRHTFFDVHESLRVGKNCLIGPGCYFTDADHGHSPGALIKEQPMQTQPMVIEDNVWLGAHCIVLRGVTIGSGAVVGAGSVVTRSIPAGAVACGNPARVIRDSESEAKPALQGNG